MRLQPFETAPPTPSILVGHHLVRRYDQPQVPVATSRTGRLALPLFAIALVQAVLFWRYLASPSWIAASSTVQTAGLVGLQLLAMTAAAVLWWRLSLVARYRPMPSVRDAELPVVTAIVPAYNEGAQVLATIDSLVASDYPPDRLHIVAIDDGSVDDTAIWIARAAHRHPGRVTVVCCPTNRGKRAALYEGFARARGEVLVTVDSDSEVLPDTLRNLVSPFVSDARVGAVAGNVRILNRDAGAIPRMLDVSFTYAFEFMRAAESMVNTVVCSPGALSAYRRGIVEACKDEWLEQRFLGRPATIGEDRALTNRVLRAGYLVKFQSNAIVLTEAPARVGQACRMLLRWARSNVRESIALARFVFTRFRPESAAGARVNFVATSLSTLMGGLLFVPSLALAVAHPTVVPFVLAGTLLTALLPTAIYLLARRSLAGLWAFPYALFSLSCLSWIGPYALLTPHRSRWLTR